MPLPVGMATVTLTGDYTHPDGTAMVGHVRLEPTAGRLVAADSGLTVQGAVRADFDTTGHVTITVVANDADGINPSGGTYQLTLNFYDADTVSFPVRLLKATPNQKIAELTPVTADDGNYLIVQGPAGPKGDTGATGPQPPLGAAGTGPTVALQSDDPTTVNARTPTAHAASHAAGGGDPVTLTQAQITGLVTALAARLLLAGGTLTGDLTLDGANLTVVRGDAAGGYRLRVTGGGLDLEIGGLDTIVSHWSNADFTGTQTDLMRWEAAGPHLIGRTQFGTTPYDTVFDLDAAGNKLGVFGAAAVAKQTVTGSRSDGTALQSLLAALVAYGLVVDGTTA